ncbi:PSP1 C-terminal domain-containing protein [Lignipirellula cremea]|uniref:PSP1 C-terminal domain-containing protein n=1 Tax=Lignipirellula cremea TaxID=2528010 RepID=A0A518DTB1_9BACT|nr:PSP1 C-terminal domain-containing protein [Lignipirellula cremea]QDU95077.1 hypothetical protein Pla8534_28890 [Lignipirellula cremea]
MTSQHWVRIGAMGSLVRLAAADACAYPRGARVVCRTLRGLEVGEVVSPDDGEKPAEGQLLRRVTVEDDLLLARIEKHRDEAYAACTALLAERQLDAVLLDVDPLFDGSTLFFHFLGDVSPEVEALTDELAEAYESKVQFRAFQELLTTGCGPGCGTVESSGCGSGGCSTCAVVAACQKH